MTATYKERQIPDEFQFGSRTLRVSDAHHRRVMLTPAAVIVFALSLLGRSPDSVVPIRFVDAPPPGVSKNAEAFITGDMDVIYVITSTDTFRRARRGPFEPGALNAFRRIASILVHEEWHLRHGPDEEGAYLAQMTALAFLRADPATISSVKRSLLAVIEMKRRR